MTTQPRLVNKQFNSPIGLYSDQNVREVLEREQQMLANGAMGIDFHNQSSGKPANLQNSAVLRMLEEEENRRSGRAGYGDYGDPRPLRDVSWPPPDYDQKSHLHSSFKDVVIPGVKRVAWPPPQEGVLDSADVVQPNAVQSQGGPRYTTQSPGLSQNNYSSQQQQQQYQPQAPYQQQPSYRPLKPLDVSSVGTGSPLASPAHNQSPLGYQRSGTPAGGKGWAPVQSPTTPLGAGAQKYFGAPTSQGYQQQPQYQPVTQAYQQYPAPEQYPQSNQYQSPPGHIQQYQQPNRYQQPNQYNQPASFAPQQQQQQQKYPYQPALQQQPHQQQPPQYQSQSLVQSAPFPNQYSSQPAVAQTQVAAPRPQPVKQVEPPPSTITLRSTAPVSQAPPAVYSAQPATASLKGGKHLRGDLKWPPENVRQRMSDEERLLQELAKGPACRPTKKEKDYTPFFEAHALNSTYPGYKIPPGTQFYRPE